MKKMTEAAVTFEEKRNSEVRACPQCSLEITNPFVERCPRCFSSLPKMNLDCTGCFYQTMCSVAKPSG